METEADVSFFLYEKIQNMKEIKQLLMKGELKAAVVNPELVYSTDVLLFASHKSLYSLKFSHLKTKTIFTELLYNLSPTRSIRDSLTMFGAQDDGTTAIFVIFGKEDSELADSLRNCIKGCLAKMDNIMALRNISKIKKVYKISDEIEDEEAIFNYLITKIASKEVLL
ncbi:EKC/KEOPS complex subunit TPRKB-like [Argiope bruennichi]|uniref:EKC/KEOPS complex subunit TPRKB like protein n=1 Tax=Argiope bruennichi TaxID=94029 RepID=A0A8T0ESD0_ARGBR|nr:EKC/KEOPS complex subunit TPRKB-like [Argiope bruennichi]KAF8778291.1 EKC/KEOPS complex subunit TPRKB like protein [Argiope bruennichi]